jgi:hypothetical protein
MRTLILSLAVLLTGCGTTVPVARKFPEAVPALQEKCPSLSTIESNGKEVSITDMLKTVVKNYGSYYDHKKCKALKIPQQQALPSRFISTPTH